MVCRASRASPLQVAGLDGLSFVFFGPTGGVVEQFGHLVVERSVEIRGDVLLLERFLHRGLDNQVCHTDSRTEGLLIRFLNSTVHGVSRPETGRSGICIYIPGLLPPWFGARDFAETRSDGHSASLSAERSLEASRRCGGAPPRECNGGRRAVVAGHAPEPRDDPSQE